MNALDKARDATQGLLDAEAVVLQSLARARSTISALEQEAMELRREVATKQVEIFTEAEFAERLKVSTSTLRRARLAGKIRPLEVGSPNCIRYSSVDHLEHLGEIFGQGGDVKNKRAPGNVAQMRSRRTG